MKTTSPPAAKETTTSPNLKIWDLAWIMKSNRPTQVRIVKITICGHRSITLDPNPKIWTSTQYLVTNPDNHDHASGFHKSSSSIFATREALIKSL